MHKKAIFFSPILLFLFILIIPITTAQELYNAETLEIHAQIDESFDLVKTAEDGNVKTIQADLLLIPQNDYRQKIITFKTSGTSLNDRIRFTWENPSLNTKKFDYEAIVSTNNARPEVQTKIPFPLPASATKGQEKYLESTTTIDANNPAIIKKATELAEGETDLFAVTFRLADWVETNINYDLNTITATASQKASWVLEHKIGVCDEMTSLFVAMARSIGIPSRFVSGISYTESPLFTEPWQAHGWAEVYFPNVGWVPFDITFGELGYIDVTHLKLRDGFDPTEPATLFEWTSHNVQLQPRTLNFDVSVLKKGKLIPPEIDLNSNAFAPVSNFGSYNVITGIIHNPQNYYLSATLKLAAPPEIKIKGRNRRSIYLAPGEKKEITWLIQVDPTLSENYIYQLPLLIYTEKNVTSELIIKAKANEATYTEQEMTALLTQDPNKNYAQSVSFECQYPPQLAIQQTATITCSIKNTGNQNLQNIEFCIAENCKILNLPINQQQQNTLNILGNTAGEYKIPLRAENNLIEKKAILTIPILDAPNLSINLKNPSSAEYGKDLTLHLLLHKNSYATPQNIKINAKGPGFKESWTLNNLEQDKTITLTVQNIPLSFTNTIIVVATWEDFNGESYTSTTTTTFTGTGKNITDKIKLLLNSVVNIFR